MRRDILGRLDGGRQKRLSLRMAPMIDMIFLLVIFFLVAAKWRPQEEFLPLRPPTTPADEHGPVKPEPLIIQIQPTEAGCLVRIGPQTVVAMGNEKIEEDMAELMSQIEKCFLDQKRYADDPIEIVCEADLKWEHLARIYNVLYGAGLADITLRMTE